MFKKIAEFFTGKKPEEPKAECPYKAEPAPSNVQGTVESPAPAIEAVVVVPEAVVPAGLVEQAPVAAKPKKPRAPAKPKVVKAVVAKAPAAPKKPRTPKAK
jgi:hypothetical protein